MVDRSSASSEVQRVHAESSGVAIRTASLGDATAIVTLMSQGRAREGRSASPGVADMEPLLEHPEAGGVLLAEIAGQLGAAIGYTLDGPTLRLFGLALAPSYAGAFENRIVGELVLAAEAFGREKGAALIAVEAAQPSAELSALVTAGYTVEYEETETAGAGVITVAELIKTL